MWRRKTQISQAVVFGSTNVILSIQKEGFIILKNPDFGQDSSCSELQHTFFKWVNNVSVIYRVAVRIRNRIKLKGRIWIRIRIKVISWIQIRIRIRINLQMTSQNVCSVSLFENFLKVLSLYLEARITVIKRIRIRIKVTSRIRIRIKVMRTATLVT